MRTKKTIQNLKTLCLMTIVLLAVFGCGQEKNFGRFESDENFSQDGITQVQYSNQKVNLDLTAMASEDREVIKLNEKFFNHSNVRELSSNALILPARTKLTIVRQENCSDAAAKKLDDSDQTVEGGDQDRASDKLQIKAHTIRLRNQAQLERLAKKYNDNPCILEVSAGTEVSLTAGPLTNDPLLYRQNQLPAIRADEGLKKLFPNLTLSQKVLIAVVDTGVEYTHDDLKNVMWRNSQGHYGYNFADRNTNPMDDNGHGTHVAGLIGAQGNNKTGVRGVLPSGAQIMAVKVFSNKGNGSTADIINGIRWAADNGAQVINLSLAGPGSSYSMKSALRYAVSKGALVLAAAGNASVDLGKSFYFPAGYGREISGMITVGSFDAEYKDRSSFSNYNPNYVEISSPGSGGIYSTYIRNWYLDLQGTSMATPVAAGAAALAISYLKSKGKSISPASLENLLKDSSTKSQALAPFVQNGNAVDVSRMADLLLAK